jgi:hypothetical protein
VTRINVKPFFFCHDKKKKKKKENFEKKKGEFVVVLWHSLALPNIQIVNQANGAEDYEAYRS